MDVGDQKAAAGDYAGALKAYQGADAIMGVPSTGIEVAKMQAKLGKLVEAADTLMRVSRYPERPDEPEPFTAARREAVRLVPEIVERTPAVIITVEEAPADAEITLRIDRVVVPGKTLELPHKVNPGTHLIEASAPGLVGSQQVTLREGEERGVTLRMVPGKSSADVPSQPSSADISPLVWVGFGVGAAGVVVGTITGVLALSQESELEQTCPQQVCAGEGEDDLDSAYALAHVSTVGFIVGGVGATVGLIALLAGGSEPTESATEQSARVTPTLGLGTVGCTGRF